MKKSVLTKSIIVGALTFLPATSIYANFSCSGYPNTVGVSTAGNVYVNIGFGMWDICSLNTTTSNNITPETCKAQYAALLASNKTHTTVKMYFNNATDTNNGPSCSTIGSWANTPSFYHLETNVN